MDPSTNFFILTLQPCKQNQAAILSKNITVYEKCRIFPWAEFSPIQSESVEKRIRKTFHAVYSSPRMKTLKECLKLQVDKDTELTLCIYWKSINLITPY